MLYEVITAIAVALGLEFGDFRFNPSDLNLITAVLVVIALVTPNLKKRLIARCRITSYNVCYTKLLRTRKKTGGHSGECQLSAISLEALCQEKSPVGGTSILSAYPQNRGNLF